MFVSVVLIAAVVFLTAGLIQRLKMDIHQGHTRTSSFASYLHINRKYIPPTLNPLLPAGSENYDIHSYIFESLLERDQNTLEWKPRLAEAWEIAADGVSYTFRLRKGMRWSDGKPLTSEDVKFSFDCIYDSSFPTAHLRPYYDSIAEVEVIDKYRVLFRAKKRHFSNFAVASEMNILPKHIYGDTKRYPSLHHTLVGSGPYKVKTFHPNRNLILDFNSRWWGAMLPRYRNHFQTPGIVFHFISDLNVVVEMIAKGKIDFSPLTVEEYLLLIKSPRLSSKIRLKKVKNRMPTSTTSIFLNLDNKLFENRDVRYALNLLFNRKFIRSRYFQDLVVEATGPWYRQSLFTPRDVSPLPFDPEEALKTFRKLGWRDSDDDRILDKKINGVKRSLNFTIFTAQAEASKFFAVLREDALRAGVDIKLRYVDWNTLSKVVSEGSYEAIFITDEGSGVEIDPYRNWHSSMIEISKTNYSRFKNDQVDKLIENIQSNYEIEDRIPIMKELYKLISYEYPGIFLFSSCCSFYAYSDRVLQPQTIPSYGLGVNQWKIKPSRLAESYVSSY